MAERRRGRGRRSPSPSRRRPGKGRSRSLSPSPPRRRGRSSDRSRSPPVGRRHGRRDSPSPDRGGRREAARRASPERLVNVSTEDLYARVAEIELRQKALKNMLKRLGAPDDDVARPLSPVQQNGVHSNRSPLGEEAVAQVEDSNLNSRGNPGSEEDTPLSYGFDSPQQDPAEAAALRGEDVGDERDQPHDDERDVAAENPEDASKHARSNNMHKSSQDEFEQRTFVATKNGEEVKVNYTVHIPERARQRALARKLKR
eukprot:jgi/Chlat1/4978/Chrsp32S04929